jgi:hypothetical protein
MATSQITAVTPINMPNIAKLERSLCMSRLLKPNRRARKNPNSTQVPFGANPLTNQRWRGKQNEPFQN